jgi:hypothetical protein
MPKMVKNDVATLLMLDPTHFPIDDDWNLEEMSSNIRRFANHLGTFADKLDRQRRRGARSNDEQEEEEESEDSAAPKAETAGSRRSGRAASSSAKKQPKGASRKNTRKSPRKNNRAAKNGQQAPTANEETEVTMDEDEEIVANFTSSDAIGCYVAKDFEDGMFRGIVQSVDGDGAEAFYHIMYSDGDEEDLAVKDFYGTSFC